MPLFLALLSPHASQSPGAPPPPPYPLSVVLTRGIPFPFQWHRLQGPFMYFGASEDFIDIGALYLIAEVEIIIAR